MKVRIVSRRDFEDYVEYTAAYTPPGKRFLLAIVRLAPGEDPWPVIERMVKEDHHMGEEREL